MRNSPYSLHLEDQGKFSYYRVLFPHFTQPNQGLPHRAVVWIEERKQAITDQLAQLGREAEAVKSLQQIRSSFKNRLNDLTDAEWRQLFIALNLGIHIRDIDSKATWRDEWFEEEEELERLKRFDIYRTDTRDEIEICIGVPIHRTEQVKDIVFNRASPD